MAGVTKQAQIELKITGIAEGETRAKALANALDAAEKSAVRLGQARPVVPVSPALAGGGSAGGSAAAASAVEGGGASGLGGIAAGAAGAAAAIYGTAKAGEALYEALGRGEKANAVADSFAALSEKVGGSASTLAALREASGGVVTDQQLMLSTNKLLVADLGLSQEQIAKLTGAAVSMSRVMGTDAADAVGDLATGILRQSPAILDNLGIYVHSEEALKKYADAHHTTVEALDATTKKSIFLAETMKALDEAQKRTGTSGANVSSVAQQLSTRWSNMGTALDQVIAKQQGFKDVLEATTAAAERAAAPDGPLAKLASALGVVAQGAAQTIQTATGSGWGAAATALAPNVTGVAVGAYQTLFPKPGGSPFVNGYGG